MLYIYHKAIFCLYVYVCIFINIYKWIGFLQCFPSLSAEGDTKVLSIKFWSQAWLHCGNIYKNWSKFSESVVNFIVWPRFVFQEKNN